MIAEQAATLLHTSNVFRIACSVLDIMAREQLPQRLLITVTQGSVIRLLPPLICAARQIDNIVARLVCLLPSTQHASQTRALFPL